MNEVSRRAFLAGGVGSLSLLAGCQSELETLDGGASGRNLEAEWIKWLLPPDERDHHPVAYVDPSSIADTEVSVYRPLHSVPVETLIATLDQLSSIDPAAIDHAISQLPRGRDAASDDPASAVVTFQGEISRSAVRNELDASANGGTFTEVEADYHGFSLHELQSPGRNRFIAISDAAVVLGPSAELVSNAVDASVGEIDRYHEVDEGFATLLQYLTADENGQDNPTALGGSRPVSDQAMKAIMPAPPSPYRSLDAIAAEPSIDQLGLEVQWMWYHTVGYDEIPPSPLYSDPWGTIAYPYPTQVGEATLVDGYTAHIPLTIHAALTEFERGGWQTQLYPRADSRVSERFRYTSIGSHSGQLFTYIRIGSGHHGLQVLDGVTGRGEWYFDSESPGHPSNGLRYDINHMTPALGDGFLFVQAGDPALYNVLLDLSDRESIWWHNEAIDDLEDGEARIRDGVLFVPQREPTVKAIDVETGDERWQFTADTGLESPESSVLGVTEDTVLVLEGRLGSPSEYWLHWLDAETGEPIARFETRVHFSQYARSVQIGDRALIPLSRGVVWGIPLTPPLPGTPWNVVRPSGDALWGERRARPAPIGGEPYWGGTVRDDVLYVLSEADADSAGQQSYFELFDISTADDSSMEVEQRLSIATDEPLRGSPAIDEEYVYLASREGVFAFDRESGEQVWSPPEISSAQAVRQGPNGEIHVISASIDGVRTFVDPVD